MPIYRGAQKYIVFQSVTTAGAANTAVVPTCMLSKDGGAQAAAVNSPPTHLGGGQWSLLLSAAETTAEVSALNHSGTGLIPGTVTIYPEADYTAVRAGYLDTPLSGLPALIAAAVWGYANRVLTNVAVAMGSGLIPSGGVFGTTVVQHLIEDAQARHYAFRTLNLPDGVLVRLLNERQRTLLLRVADRLEPLLGASATIAAEVDGTLIGIDDDEVPYFVTTSGTGFPIQFDADSVPFFDPQATPIALDPFGADGDDPGFPLPTDMVRLTAITAVLTDGTSLPVDILQERSRLDTSRMTGGLAASIIGRRLVAIRNPMHASGTRDLWDSVTSVQFSMIAVPTLSSLSDAVTVPAAMQHVLVACLAEFMASATKDCPENDKRRFERQREAAEAVFEQSVGTVLDDVTTNSTLFLG